MLIVFVAAEDDYLLTVIATKNVDGKDTHITWLTSRRFRVWFPVRSFLFGLFSFLPHLSVPAHSASLFCFYITRQSVLVVCSSISALWWIRHSSVDDSTSHHFMLGPCRYSWSRCNVSLLTRPFFLLEQVSETVKNIVTFHFPPDKCGLGQ